MWPLLLSIRYFLAKRRNGIISFINVTSILGVAVGVAALIIVISVMNGFDEEVRDKIIGTYSHLMVFRDQGISDPESVKKKILKLDEVISGAPFITGQAVLRKGEHVVGVLVKGIDLEEERSATEVVKNIRFYDNASLNEGIILGKELMRNLGISRGEAVEIIVPYSAIDIKREMFNVVGEFSSGRYDYDANMVFIGIEKAKSLYKTKGNVSGVAFKVKDAYAVNRVKNMMQETLGYTYFVRTWMDTDRNLVAALAMEKKMMFIILGVIIFIACFNICSSLIMIVMEKTKDIGILRAMGSSSFAVGLVFLLEGLFIGALGIIIGSFSGVYIAERVNRILELVKAFTGFDMFPKDVYYFTKIPVSIDPKDTVAIILLAIVCAMFSGIYPAVKAAKLDPMDAIRYE